MSAQIQPEQQQEAEDPLTASKKDRDGFHLPSWFPRGLTTVITKILGALKFVLQHTPILNLLYDLFDETPSVDAIKEYLNLIGLVDALMLGMAVTFITAASYQDLLDTDKRYLERPGVGENDGYYELYKSSYGRTLFDDLPPSAKFSYHCYLAVGSLASGLFMAVLTYVDLVNKNFSSTSRVREEELVAAWWLYARYVCLIAFGLTLCGAIESIAITLDIVVMVFPDYYVEKHGDLKKIHARSPYSLAVVVIYGIWATFGIALVLLGLGTKNRFYHSLPYENQEIRELQSVFSVNSKKHWEDFFNSSTEIKDYFHFYREEYLDMFESSRFDFNDRMEVSDAQLQDIGITLTGHRIKLLSLFKTYIPESGKKQKALGTTVTEEFAESPASSQ